MEPPTRLEDQQDISDLPGFPTQPKLVPTMIVWNYDGHEVAIEGSFDNWTTRHTLQRTGKNFTVVKLLPPGVYQVCNFWRLCFGSIELCSINLLWMVNGNMIQIKRRCLTKLVM